MLDFSEQHLQIRAGRIPATTTRCWRVGEWETAASGMGKNELDAVSMMPSDEGRRYGKTGGTRKAVRDARTGRFGPLNEAKGRPSSVGRGEVAATGARRRGRTG